LLYICTPVCVYRCMLPKILSPNPIRRLIPAFVLLTALTANCGGEPDGLTPREVTQHFLQAVAKNDESTARHFVTTKSKLLVAVGMKMISLAETGTEAKDKKKEIGELRKDLHALSATVQCDEIQEKAEMVECYLQEEPEARFPLRKTSDGWRVDLFTMIERTRERMPQNEPGPGEEPGLPEI